MSLYRCRSTLHRAARLVRRTLTASAAAAALAVTACTDAVAPGREAPGLVARAVTAADPVGTTLVSRASGKCADVPGASRERGTQLVIAPCHGGENQRFQLPAVGASGEIRVYGGEQCLDAWTAQGNNGDKIAIHPCHGGANQQWTHTSDGAIVGVNGRCIDVAGASTDDNAPLILWDCHGATNQQWDAPQGRTVDPRPTGAVTIASTVAAGQCVEVAGASRDQGASVASWYCHARAQQQWVFTAAGELQVYADEGAVKCLDPVPSGWDANGAIINDGAALKVWSCQGIDAQRWELRPTGEIVGKGGKCLDLQTPTVTPGAELVVRSCDGRASQRWRTRPANAGVIDEVAGIRFVRTRLPNGFSGVGINEAGDIVGTTADGAALLSTRGQLTAVPAPAGYGRLGAVAVNDAGLVLGFYSVEDPARFTSYPRPYLWSAASGFRDLGGFGAPGPDGTQPRVLPTALNNDGTVVGTVSLFGVARPFRWTPSGGYEWIGESGHAIALNNPGQVLIVQTDNGSGPAWLLEPSGARTALPMYLGGWPVMRALSDAGLVAGSRFFDAANESCLTWSVAEGYRTLSSGSRCAVRAVNSAGRVVGAITVVGPPYEAGVAFGGAGAGIVRLGPPTQNAGSSAGAINDRNQIVGRLDERDGGFASNVLWTPEP